MRIPFIFLLVFSSLVCSSQLVLQDKVLDFGQLQRGSDRILESSLVNYSEESATLLRVEVGSKEFDIRTDRRTLAPGDTMRVRIKLNPMSKGTRKDELTLYLNSETVSMEIRAEIKYVDSSDNTPCPDFEKAAVGRASDWQAFFKVIDRDTREPISKAGLILTGKSGVTIQLTTDKKGEVLSEMPIDFYTIRATSKGYAKYSLESYVNRRNKDFVLELMKGGGSIAVLRPGENEDQIPEPPPLIVEIREQEKEVDNSTDEEKEFALSQFRENNAVFLVDISTSMRKQERIELLKSSMIELASILRPEDVISIVTYATNTDVVLSGEYVSDVAKITEIIESLEAEGKTAGEAGLKKAYSICKKHFIPEGNNHVYLATDGAFNKGNEKVKKLARAKAKKQMGLSVLSIRSSIWVDKQMKDLASAGRGQHLSLQEVEDQSQLKALVKELSRR